MWPKRIHSNFHRPSSRGHFALQNLKGSRHAGSRLVCQVLSDQAGTTCCGSLMFLGRHWRGREGKLQKSVKFTRRGFSTFFFLCFFFPSVWLANPQCHADCTCSPPKPVGQSQHFPPYPTWSLFFKGVNPRHVARAVNQFRDNDGDKYITLAIVAIESFTGQISHPYRSNSRQKTRGSFRKVRARLCSSINHAFDVEVRRRRVLICIV